MLLGTLAASVLIISSAWLMELSQPVASPTIVLTRPAQPWERMAMTLRAEPLLPQQDDNIAQFADAELAEWMLQRLSEN